MLTFAKLHEDELLKTSFKLCTDKKYRFYHLGYICNPQLKDNDWDKIK